MAQGPIDKFKTGFSGYIQPAVGIGYSKSISDVSDDTKQIDSLYQDANINFYDSTSAIVSLGLAWRF